MDWRRGRASFENNTRIQSRQKCRKCSRLGVRASKKTMRSALERFEAEIESRFQIDTVTPVYTAHKPFDCQLPIYGQLIVVLFVPLMVSSIARGKGYEKSLKRTLAKKNMSKFWLMHCTQLKCSIFVPTLGEIYQLGHKIAFSVKLRPV